MNYEIAGEHVKYDSCQPEIIDRFKSRFVSHDTVPTITIDLASLPTYIEAHWKLSAVQAELIFSLQQFFAGALRNNKLLLHASVVKNGGSCCIFAEHSAAGKSTIACQFATLIPGASVVSDDRTVIGLSGGQLLVWSTPWGKTDGCPRAGYPVRSVVYIEPDTSNEIETISLERMKKFCAGMYPPQFESDIGNMLDILFPNANLYLLKNGMTYFSAGMLNRIHHDL